MNDIAATGAQPAEFYPIARVEKAPVITLRQKNALYGIYGTGQLLKHAHVH